jgi:hypothetical protein
MSHASNVLDAVYSLLYVLRFPPLQPEVTSEARDVESRMLAIASLGQLCQGICKLPFTRKTSTIPDPLGTSLPVAPYGKGISSSVTSSKGDGVQNQDLDLLQSCVLPVVLTGLHDYETDNRGDVGSWVRGAAMLTAVQLFELLVAMHPSAQHPLLWPPQQQHMVGGWGDGEAWGRGVPARVRLVDEQQQRLLAWQAGAVAWCTHHGALGMSLSSGPSSEGTATNSALSEGSGVEAGVTAAAAAAKGLARDSLASTAPLAAAADCGGGLSRLEPAAAAEVSLADMAVAVVGGLLQQGLGRIARLRESAIKLLQELVDETRTSEGMSPVLVTSDLTERSTQLA